MNILLTTVSLDGERGGGTAQRTAHLARHLALLGHAARVVTMQGGSLADELATASIPVHVTGLMRIRYQIPFLNLPKLHALIRDTDAIHVLGYWNMLSVATAAIARLRRKPYVLSAAGEFAALAESPPLAKSLFHAIFGRRMIAGASSIVAVTPLERDQIIGQFGLAPERVIVVPNGVDEPRHTITGDARFPAGRFVLFMGRLAPIKGPDLLVEAFAAVRDIFPDVTLVLAGPDFGIRDDLERQVRNLGIAGRVVFTGFLDGPARETAYRLATLLAVPSRAEAMSLVALEAGAAGTPVLLTDRCGFDEVDAAGGGRVVPASVDGLTAGLRDLLAEDLPAMGERLRRLVMDRFAWPAIAARLAEHLDSLRARR